VTYHGLNDGSLEYMMMEVGGDGTTFHLLDSDTIDSAIGGIGYTIIPRGGFRPMR